MPPPTPHDAGPAVPDSGAEGLHNPGAPFDRAWLDELGAAAADPALPARCEAWRRARPPAPSEPVELVRAIGCLDLTTLTPDDTPARVRALCERALEPVPAAHLARLGIVGEVRVAAVCVYPRFVPTALEALADSAVRVCTVAAGFPQGAGSLAARVAEVREARRAGAHEIDVVIRRALAREGSWQALYDEIRAFRAACDPVPMKVILGTGELPDAATVARAGGAALLAGAAFLKTSTGKEPVNATLDAGAVMARGIRAYARRTGFHAGLKPAGGIGTPQQALAWMALVRDELGAVSVSPSRFRIGASSLLDALVERLSAL